MTLWWLFHIVVHNKQMRHFLQLELGSAAHKILVSLQFPHAGTKKGRTYEITNPL